MQKSEILKKIRKIEIRTRGLSRHIFAGRYHSAFKGKGMMFSEVREYQYGDPIRDIDWNVTARFNHPYVKVFEEERELTVMILADVSGSQNFGSFAAMKRDIVTEIAALLSFSAIQNNDKVGVIFFSDRVEKFIPPKKGRTHILRIISELLTFQPQGRGTNIAKVLEYFSGAVKKRSTAFLISDFNDKGYEQSMMIANNKHDLVAIKVVDNVERKLPDVGLIRMLDAETGKEFWLDTSIKRNQNLYEQWRNENEQYFNSAVRRSGVDNVEVQTDRDYVQPLVNLFRKREA
ncbi:MAG TPA: DUF58 domain-containing protein [Salinivirgaceae bacterium]|nr:DUF58 domain-containing protein [Salinivirgaceae bacterium]